MSCALCNSSGSVLVPSRCGHWFHQACMQRYIDHFRVPFCPRMHECRSTLDPKDLQTRRYFTSEFDPKRCCGKDSRFNEAFESIRECANRMAGQWDYVLMDRLYVLLLQLLAPAVRQEFNENRRETMEVISVQRSTKLRLLLYDEFQPVEANFQLFEQFLDDYASMDETNHDVFIDRWMSLFGVFLSHYNPPREERGEEE